MVLDISNLDQLAMLSHMFLGELPTSKAPISIASVTNRIRTKAPVISRGLLAHKDDRGHQARTMGIKATWR